MTDGDPSAIHALVECDEHRALAREVAEKSIVLLRNEGSLLPLDRAELAALAVVGPLADAENIGDEGSSKVTPAHVVTPLAGIEAAAASTTVTHVAGPALSAADETTIAAADAVVVVVGLTANEEGEKMPGIGGDRDTLALPPEHAALVAAVAALNPATIVVLEGGASITMAGWIDAVPAVLMAWYPGMEGGTALARILFGEVCPSGKLPVSFPVDESQLPAFVHDEDAVTYGYYHGYRHLDHEGLEPLFPFGHGLSYTRFAYSKLSIDPPTVGPDGEIEVSFVIENTGTRAGEEIAQLYVGYPETAVDRPERELRAFARVALAPGEKKTVTLTVRAATFGYYDVGAHGWQVEQAAHRIEVGPSARTLPLAGSVAVK